MTRARTGWRRVGSLAIVTALALTSCWWGGDDDEEPAPTTVADDDTGDSAADGPIVTVEGRADGARATTPLGLRLGEGSSLGAVADPVTVVDGTPLSPADVEAIFERLPAWDVPPDDVEDFNRPVDSLEPPLVGDTVDIAFPPPVAEPPVDADAGPLEVLRFQPEGAVDVAPFLSVTFDQPMVPLATLDQLDAADVPVVVDPPIEGRWRWIGTRTLRFELVPGEIDRLPAATEYTVEVPAGTRAANGAVLGERVAWAFTTPTPTITRFAGDLDDLPLDPVFVAVFDQRVDPVAVLETVELTVGGETTPVRLATDDEVDGDEPARSAVAQALESRAVAFTPASELPPDAPLTVTIGPGVPSAEGPLTSATTDSFDGRTFGKLRIERAECNDGNDCEPGAPFRIEFSNRLDPDAFRADQVRVEPDVAGLRINVFGNSIELWGATEGRTTYRVGLDGDLRDIFGQTLGNDAELDWRVGSAPPSLRGLERDWITTDPGAELPLVSVTTVNHDSVRVRAWAVTPANLTEFRDYLDEQWRDAAAEPPDWPLVYDEVIGTEGGPDRFVETAIDLSSAFEQAGSQVVVRVEPTMTVSENDDDYWRNRPRTAWVQSTTLGLDAFHDHDELLIWTTDLATGEPVGGVPVELIGDGRIATTDDEGVARLELGSEGVVGLWATAGDRTSFLIGDWYEGWTARPQRDEGRWYVFDDRGIYRPGETVRITGWVRRLAWSDDAQLALYSEGAQVSYRAWDAQGSELASATAPLNALGGFNLTIDVPEASNLGRAWVEFQLIGLENDRHPSANHTFQIQDFRTPEFEVSARVESQPPHFTAQPATVAVDAEYFAGGPLPDADVSWLVSTRETTYRPPNWDDYTFGIWQPWWYAGVRADTGGEFADDVAFDDCFDCGPPFDSAEYETYEGRTDAGGTHYLQIDFDGPDVDLPTSVTAEATVVDVNRQAWASRVDLLVHSAEYYVGLRSDRTFVERGTPLRIDAVVTDVDGNVVAGRDVEVTAGRLEWVFSGGSWTEQVADTETCALTSTADATDRSMRCEFSTDVGGTYRVTAVVADDTEHRSRTELTQWVTGGEGRPERNVVQQEVLIVPDRETYQPGDTAELLVQAPFAPAHGLVTVMRHGILTTETFEAEEGGAVIEVTIEDAYIPNVTVQVDMVGSDIRTDDDGRPQPDLPARTAYATGRLDLSIPPLARTLDVTATPAAAAVTPGDDTTVTVEVRDDAGDPVAGAGVAVVVVDEAVLSLTAYDLADPLDVFYDTIWSDLQSQYMRASVQLTRTDLVTADDTAANRAAVPADGADLAGGDDTATADAEESAADDGAAPGDGSAIDLRSDFDALAVYAPGESTGGDGTVTVDVPLPDNLTRYRVMAVAVDGAEHFGKGESTITARLPLMVRPSAPRFLNFGDAFEFPVVVQNQTAVDLEVDVALQLANLDPTGEVGKRVTVPANDRVEVRFPVAADEVGTARYRVAAVSGEFADAAAGELPVYTPATAEAFATYGAVDEGAVGQPLLAPTGVFPQFGGLEVNTSSTALQALTDAVLYLYEYRYESSDAYASRIMAVAALRDVLDAFDADGLPSAAELDRKVGDDVERLAALQNDDGGWPYWQRGRRSIPWQSIQATHALVLAERAGYAVPADTLDRALQHLAEIEEHIPSEYGEAIRNTLSSYALYVRGEAGRTDVGKAQELYRRVGDELGLDAIAWLWPSITDGELRDEIERLVANRAVETAGAATFATDYGEDAYLIAHSDRRTDGIVLDALITETPASDLISKVVAGLLGNQTRGRWNNAHENAFILLALHRYFETFEAVTPDFVARVWLGDLYAAEHEFRGRTTDRAATLVPTAELISAGDSDLVIAKDGPGRLYYRLGLRYAPSDLDLDPRDEGFVVDRAYEAIDDPDDVVRDADGTWRIRAGATVRVRLTMVADARRTHVALIDPLPAGLEPLNPALAVSQSLPPSDDGDEVGPARWFWWWNWFEHQNLRDDRAEAFTSYLPGGTYDYTYVARATTPGEFVVPPTRAEEIYAPEVFGRSATDRVVVR